MNPTISTLIVIAVVLLMGWFIYRSYQRQVKKILSGERSLDDRDIFMRRATPTPALILSKTETIKPEAKGIAKVDLQLEIRQPEGDPISVTTTWLVETPSLPELETGKEVMVKFDPKKPERVFPAVSWARLWLFDKK